MSAALAFGPAIDAAKSPERRVKMKLTTRTVRHTKAASHSLRTINKIIFEDYDSARVAASADIEPLATATSTSANVFCICARQFAQKPTATTAALTVYELRSTLRTLVRNQRRDTARECLSDACGRKIASAGVVAPTPTSTRPSTMQRCSDVACC